MPKIFSENSGTLFRLRPNTWENELKAADDLKGRDILMYDLSGRGHFSFPML